MRKSLSYLAVLLAAIFFSLSPVFAQNITISGVVKHSTTGEGIPSVSVTVKGGTRGSYTDGNGKFELKVPTLPVTLVFSSIGFDSKEVVVDNSSTSISVSLDPASSLGQEVVVSATRT